MDVVGSKMNTLLSRRQGKPIGIYLPHRHSVVGRLTQMSFCACQKKARAGRVFLLMKTVLMRAALQIPVARVAFSRSSSSRPHVFTRHVARVLFPI